MNAGKGLNAVLLNLGCGYIKRIGWINVDKYDNCDPDVVHDLNEFPYPWDDNSIDGIEMFHTLEHLNDWWGALIECARILKPGARIEIRVPDESSTSALTYRDHNHVFSRYSFHGVWDREGWGSNAWAELENDTVPLRMIGYKQIPHNRYKWMMRWPLAYVLAFCSNHLRNFIWEQQLLFEKVGDRDDSQA